MVQISTVFLFALVVKCSLPQTKLEQCITKISVNMNFRPLLWLKDNVTFHLHRRNFRLLISSINSSVCFCTVQILLILIFLNFIFQGKRNKKKNCAECTQYCISQCHCFLLRDTEDRKKTPSFWLNTAPFFHFYVNHYPKPICHLSGIMSSWAYKRNAFLVVGKKKR